MRTHPLHQCGFDDFSCDHCTPPEVLICNLCRPDEGYVCSLCREDAP